MRTQVRIVRTHSVRTVRIVRTQSTHTERIVRILRTHVLTFFVLTNFKKSLLQKKILVKNRGIYENSLEKNLFLPAQVLGGVRAKSRARTRERARARS